MSCYIGPPTWYLRTAGGLMTGNITFAGAQTVDGIDISAIHQAKIITGTYVGNGNNNRSINIGVNLAAKTMVYVVIKGLEARAPAHRIEYAQGDLAMAFVNVADLPDKIQCFNATGFEIGTHADVNFNAETYRWIAIYQEY